MTDSMWIHRDNYTIQVCGTITDEFESHITGVYNIAGKEIDLPLTDVEKCMFIGHMMAKLDREMCNGNLL